MYAILPRLATPWGRPSDLCNRVRPPRSLPPARPNLASPTRRQTTESSLHLTSWLTSPGLSWSLTEAPRPSDASCPLPSRSPSGESDGPEVSLRTSLACGKDSAPRPAAHGFLAHGSSVICPLSWAPLRACDLHVRASPSRVIHTSLTGVLTASAARLVPITCIPPSPRQHIRWRSPRCSLLGESPHRAVSG
jgi:hypothetical protein